MKKFGRDDFHVLHAAQFEVRDEDRFIIADLKTHEGRIISFAMTGQMLVKLGELAEKARETFPDIEEWQGSATSH
ncbi:MAG: hypothetical protein AB7I42_29570 [Bradyrhizobium sp.]|uniref:hypothetical protein n=1 Tax=Bradyrhizobium sp. TaxID=376 RepID=UPI003D0968E1